jgi:hypothetical protein
VENVFLELVHHCIIPATVSLCSADICFGPTINKPLEESDVLQSLGTSRTVLLEPVEKLDVEVIKSPLTFFSSYAIIVKQAFGLSGVFGWYRPTSF